MLMSKIHMYSQETNSKLSEKAASLVITMCQSLLWICGVSAKYEYTIWPTV